MPHSLRSGLVRVKRAPARWRDIARNQLARLGGLPLEAGVAPRLPLGLGLIMDSRLRQLGRGGSRCGGDSAHQQRTAPGRRKRQEPTTRQIGGFRIGGHRCSCGVRALATGTVAIASAARRRRAPARAMRPAAEQAKAAEVTYWVPRGHRLGHRPIAAPSPAISSTERQKQRSASALSRHTPKQKGRTLSRPAPVLPRSRVAYDCFARAARLRSFGSR